VEDRRVAAAGLCSTVAVAMMMAMIDGLKEMPGER
jgi:hypothetical protein